MLVVARCCRLFEKIPGEVSIVSGRVKAIKDDHNGAVPHGEECRIAGLEFLEVPVPFRVFQHEVLTPCFSGVMAHAHPDSRSLQTLGVTEVITVSHDNSAVRVQMQRRRRTPDIEPRRERPRAPMVRRDATIELTLPSMDALLAQNSEDTSIGEFQQAGLVEACTVYLFAVCAGTDDDL